jgi:hypothetical protein
METKNKPMFQGWGHKLIMLWLMASFFLFIGFLFAFVPKPHIEKTKTYKALEQSLTRPDKWINLTTDRLFNILAKRHELSYWTEDGKKHPTNWSKLRRNIVNAYDASELNPSSGSRKQTTIKLLDNQYIESRFNQYAFHLNSDGSWDIGLGGINSCNWFDKVGAQIWENFCIKQGLDPKNISLLYDSRVNTFYMAYLMELYGKKHWRLYTRKKSLNNHYVYKNLKSVVPRETGGNKGGSNEKFSAGISFSFAGLGANTYPKNSGNGYAGPVRGFGWHYLSDRWGLYLGPACRQVQIRYSGIQTSPVRSYCLR